MWSSCPTDIFWLIATGRSRGGLAYVSQCTKSHTPRKRLYDRMWFFVTESLLAFTIFRDEFDIPLAVMFGFLLFVKSFHWLLADRIEWVQTFLANRSTMYLLSLQMNQMPYPGPTTLFHIRISGLFFTLWLTNVVMLAFAAESILSNGVGVIILFASEVSKTHLLRVSHYHRAPSVFDSHGQLDEFKIQVYPFCHRIPSRGIPRGRECATMGGQEHVDFLRRFDHRCVPPSNSFGSFLT